MLRSFKFPFQFNPSRLVADLSRVGSLAWTRHFNDMNYAGEWSGLALRAASPRAQDIVPRFDAAMRFQDTPLLEECPGFRDVLDTFQCSQRSVRLLKLCAGSSIKEHTDEGLDYAEGEIRVHVPIVTDAEVYFFLNDERLIMAPGECWYTNVNLPHRVDNRSAIDRVHLVIDCEVNDWLRGYLEPARRDSYRLASPSHLKSGRYFSILNGAIPLALFQAVTAYVRAQHDAGMPLQFMTGGSTYRLTYKTPQGNWTVTIECNPCVEIQKELGDRAAISFATIETQPDCAGEHADKYGALLRFLQRYLPAAELLHAATMHDMWTKSILE